MFKYKKTDRLWLSALILAVTAGLGAGHSYAQAIFGALYGTATDSTGAAIPNATVTVTDQQKGISRTVKTNADGAWSADHLIPDTYTVKIESGSFAPSTTTDIIVHADASQQVDLTLQVAGSSTTVSVSSGDVPALKTDRADVAQIMDERAVQNLPNLTRNLTQFALLTPGMQHSSFNIAGPENPQGGIQLNSNGSNYGEQGFILDGTDNRDPVLGIIVINPTLDSIAETKFTTQNYDAEFGGAAGGIVNVTTKSGANKIHGDAFWYRHSDAFYARDPFKQFQPDPVTGRIIPSELYSQFGGSISGPVIKDKTFFFLDYQGLRRRVGNSLLQNVPTALARNTCITGTGTCDLSQYTTGNLRNPITGQTYASNQVPTSALSPQARAILAALPAPNTTGIGTTNNYVASGNGRVDGDQADIRLDHQMSEKLHLFGRYDYALFRLVGIPVYGAAGGAGFGIGGTSGRTTTQNQSATLGFDYAVTPTLLTDMRGGFLSYHVAENKYDAGTAPAAAAGIPNLNVGGDTSGSPTYDFNESGISGFGTQGCNCPLLQSEQVFQLVNNWTKVWGNHTLKFGGDLRYAKNVRNASDSNRAGRFVFAASSTATPTSSGLDLASALFGAAATFQRFDVFVNDQYSYQKRGAFYAQDSWRVTQKFQLNYGVRWDVIFPETVNGAGHGGFASLQTGGIRVAGVGPFGTNGNQKMDYTNLAGRIGFTYQVHPNTVIRGGVGTVYDTIGYFGTIYGSVLSHNLPVQANESQSNVGAVGGYVTTLAAPPVRPTSLPTPANGIIPFQDAYGQQFRPERIQLPKVDQFNLTLQQQFGNNLTAEIAYVGNVGERVYPGETYGYDLNEPTLPTNAITYRNGTDTQASRRPYNLNGIPAFNGVYNGVEVHCCSNGMTSAAPSGRANYHSLQTKIDKRFAHGLSFNANYTWSKAMNYANDAAFNNYRRYSYGRNDTNRAQVFVVSGVYDLPFGKNRMFAANSNRLVNSIIGDWTLSGSSTWEAGRPFTATYGECGLDQDLDTNAGTNGATSDCRPNGNASAFAMSAGDLDPATHSRRYFTPVGALASNGAVAGPFSRPAFGTFGSIGRNTFVGPRDYFADAALIKNIGITERVKAQFQFQAFNVFNHAALDIPTASNSHCIDCSTGGSITSLESNSTMRQLQFAARLTF
jgi:hypothetical protein